MKRWYFIVFLIFTKCAFSQDVSFRASAPEVVELGQQFRLIYAINAKADNFSAPAINAFSVLAGPSTSQSSNVSIVNGKVTQTFELRYTYVVQANKEGAFIIPPAEVVVNKKTYKSNPVKIEVIKGAPKQKQSVTTPSGINQTSQTTDQDQISKSDLYIKIYVSKTKVHQEEHVVATIKLFSKLNITRLDNAKLPSLQGFIAEDLEVPPLTSLNRERINDQIYLTGVLKKYLLYPQKTGKIVIEPFELDVYYQKPNTRRSRSMFDDFFGAVDSEGRKVISNSVVINVSELPDNKPYNFSGAVGKLQFSATVDNLKVKTNDAVTLRVKIAGNGNLKYINPPKIEFPSDFDVYDPKVSDNIKYTEGGAVGNKTFEYLMIPRHAGNFTIPAFNFSYFDTETDQYKTRKAGPFKIDVTKSETDTTVTVSSAFTKEDVKFFGQDIRFIKNNIQLKKLNKFIFGSRVFYIVYILVIIIFLVVLLFRRMKTKENENVMLVKNKKANKFARKRLNIASGFMKQDHKEAFYEELVKALWGYISDKLGISVASLSKDNARTEMITKNVDAEYIDQILNIIDRCEYARYAPVTEETKMDTLYNDAIKVISKLQQKLR
ncbi:MAG: BatD family protein [Bacteroidales bacterium]|nr:BatD family protein [Bacteroidales bacterium]